RKLESPPRPCQRPLGPTPLGQRIERYPCAPAGPAPPSMCCAAPGCVYRRTEAALSAVRCRRPPLPHRGRQLPRRNRPCRAHQSSCPRRALGARRTIRPRRRQRPGTTRRRSMLRLMLRLKRHSMLHSMRHSTRDLAIERLCPRRTLISLCLTTVSRLPASKAASSPPLGERRAQPRPPLPI
ncbi:MAG: hypothetical protein QOI13_310, partial [Paraburkholderia sp.]|nr:hypothetical protein [Paraburkholderia sp.]